MTVMRYDAPTPLGTVQYVRVREDHSDEREDGPTTTVTDHEGNSWDVIPGGLITQLFRKDANPSLDRLHMAIASEKSSIANMGMAAYKHSIAHPHRPGSPAEYCSCDENNTCSCQPFKRGMFTKKDENEMHDHDLIDPDAAYRESVLRKGGRLPAAPTERKTDREDGLLDPDREDGLLDPDREWHRMVQRRGGKGSSGSTGT